MAEQLMMAYAVPATRLASVVGGRDPAFVMGALQHPQAAEICGTLEDVELERLVREIDAGTLDVARRVAYRRVLRLVAELEGTRLAPECIVMPGRGWQDLAPAWERWGQPALARIWGGCWNGEGPAEPAWPWSSKSAATSVDWPIALLVPGRDAGVLREELDGFERDVVVDRGVPETIDRFGDPDDWDPEELADEIEHLAAGLRRWLAFLAPGQDLLLWHDGQV